VIRQEEGRLLKRENTEQGSDVAKLAGGGLIGMIGKIGGQGLAVLGNMIVARMLGPGNYGLYAIGWTIVRMVGLFAPLGLDKGVVYYATRHRNGEHPRFVGALRQSIGMSLLSGALLGAALFAASPWVGESVFHKIEVVPTLRWFAPIFVAYAGLRVAAAATTVSQRVKFSALSKDIVQPFIFIVLVLTLCGIGLGVVGAIGATLGSFVVALVTALLFLRRLFPEVASFRVRSPFLVNELLAFSIPSAFAGIFGMYMIWTNRLLVGYFCSLEETGVYQAVSQIALLFPMIQAAFAPIFSPMSADLYNRKEIKRLDELYKVSTKWVLYVSIPFLLVTLVMPREVVTTLFGAQYAQGWLPLVILVLAQAVNIGTGAVGLLLVMTGHQRCWSVISGMAFLVNLGLSALLIPAAGITGAAVGLAVAYVGMFILGVREVKQLVGVWPYDRRYYKGGLAALLTAGALLAFGRIVPRVFSLLPLTICIIGSILSVGIFGGVLFLVGFDSEDREFLRLLQARWTGLRVSNDR